MTYTRRQRLKTGLLLSVFLLLISTISGKEQMLVTRELEAELRSQVTWEVEQYENSIFHGWTLDDFKTALCGDTSESTAPQAASPPPTEADALPEHFDSREKWGHCVHPIRVQGHCGSCWAFGTTEAMSDRFCIAGKDVILAPQDLVSCDKSNHACNGGSIELALKYFEHSGCVSEDCFPYVSGKSGEVPACPAGKCPHGGVSWVKHYCQANTVKVITDITAMKQAIYDHGPITTRFDHYQDFNLYKGGVYYHKAGAFVCGHVMKTIGWGKENGVDYWILANTYGTEWGEKGFVRFKMRDCKIDNFMVMCMPKV